MKINWNNKYATISAYAILVICISILFFNAVSEIDSWINKTNEYIGILQPFIIGFVIAYLLNFLLKLYENKLFTIGKLNNVKNKPKRAICTLLSYITAGLILYIFIQFVMPKLVDSLSGLIEDIPRYIDKFIQVIDNSSNELQINEEYVDIAKEKADEAVSFILNLGANLIPVIGNIVKIIASSIWNILLGIIISVYFLIGKEQFFALGKKITYAVLNKDRADSLMKLANRTNYTFGRYLSGMIIDSALIGTIMFFILTILKMPYAILIAVIIGCTNIIPVFGPFLGAIPSAIIILFVSPIKAFWFLIIILVMQQIDGNIIAPKILGDSIGIGPFWILFSVVIAGNFFGLVGMVIGVPVFAIVYFVLKDIVEHKLKKKGLPTNTSNYLK